MYIAVTCDAQEADGLVPKTFREAPFLMIIDTDKNQIVKIYRKQDEENIAFAKKVLEHECEALICGPMERKPFNLVAGAGITRYDGSGHKVQKAYDYMNAYQLKWIADYIGGPGAFGGSHNGECECEEGDGNHLSPVERAEVEAAIKAFDAEEAVKAAAGKGEAEAITEAALPEV